jgi:small subunit ribosomal protein S6
MSLQRFYEVMFIVRPDVLDEDLDKLIAGIEGTVTGGGGALRSTEKLGRRKLAYTVRKFNDGNYVLLTIDADGVLVKEVERRLRVTEPVIKFITVRMDDEEKRLTKVRAIRASRKKLSAQPAAPAPAPVPPVAAEAPAAAEAPIEEGAAVAQPVAAEPAAVSA